MQQILVYSDSLSWGILPGTREPLGFEERWPGVLEHELAKLRGDRVRVIEDYLSTNDFQSMHPHEAWHSAEGLATLIRAVREAPIEPGVPMAPILVVCPPSILTPKGAMRAK